MSKFWISTLNLVAREGIICAQSTKEKKKKTEFHHKTVHRKKIRFFHEKKHTYELIIDLYVVILSWCGAKWDLNTEKWRMRKRYRQKKKKKRIVTREWPIIAEILINRIKSPQFQSSDNLNITDVASSIHDNIFDIIWPLTD